MSRIVAFIEFFLYMVFFQCWSLVVDILCCLTRSACKVFSECFPFSLITLPSLIDAFLYGLSITINYKCLVGSAPPALMHPPRRPRALLFKAIWIFAAERELMKRAIKYFTQKMYLGIRILEC